MEREMEHEMETGGWQRPVGMMECGDLSKYQYHDEVHLRYPMPKWF